MTWHHLSLMERARHFVIVMFIMVAAAAPFLLFDHAFAASKTWDGGCGVDTTWSCANNWSDNIVPVSGDTVVFDGSFTGNSTVDASFAGTVTTMTVGSGYTGTITLSRSLTVSSAMTFNGGTFTAGSQTVTLGGFIMGGGVFNASSGTTSVSGGVNITAGTFNANGGTVNVTGGTSNTIICNNATFNLVTLTSTGGTKTISSDCSLPLGNNPTVGNSGGITLNGVLSGSGLLTLGGGATHTLGVGSALSGFTGITSSNGSITVNGTYNFGSYSPFSTGGNVTVSSGATFTAPSGTMSIGSAFTVSSGSTFNANSGTVNFNATTSATLSCGNKTFNLVTFTHTGGTKTVGSDCSLPLGSSPTAGTSSGAITLNGTLSGTSTLTTTGTLTLNSGGSLSGLSGLTSAGLTVNGTYNFGSYSPFTVSSTFILNSGASFTAPTGTASFNAGVLMNSGSTFNANGGTVNFGGAASVSLSCNNAVFNLVTLTHTSGTKTIGSDCSLPLGNNPSTTGPITLNGTLSGSGTITYLGTITLGTTGALSGFSGLSAVTLIVSGSYNFGSYSPFTVAATFQLNSGANFIAPTGTASFASTFTVNSAAAFNANGGTVNFNRTSASTVTLTCSNAVFNLVTFTNTSGSTESVSSDCNFPLGNNPTVGSGGSLTLNGTLSGSGTMNKVGGMTLNTTGVVSGFSGLTAVNNLTVNGTYNFGSYSPFSVGAIFTLGATGSFTAPSGTASFAGNFTLNSGSTFNANGGIVNFNGGGAFLCNNAIFNLVTLNNTTSINIGNNCQFPLGNNPHTSNGGTIILQGNLSGSGILYFNMGFSTGQFNIRDGYSLTGFTGFVTDAVLAIQTTNDTVDFGNYAPVTVGKTFIITSGTFIAPAGTMTVGLNFTNNAAGSSFDANGGTVVLNGTNQVLSGDVTFHNLSKTISSADTLTFTAGNTVTIQGTLTLQGASGALLSMVSSAPGTPWLIDAQGATSVGYVNVSDSHVLGASITTCNSTDSGRNSGWVFNPAACSPAHGSDAATSVNNYEALQASLASQSDQDQGGPPTAAFSNDLASKLNDFVKQFPVSKGLMTAAKQLLRVMLGLVIFGLLFVGFLWLLAWRRRKEEEEASLDAHPQVIAPGINRPPATSLIPGSTIRPESLVPKGSVPFKIHHNPGGGSRP